MDARQTSVDHPTNEVDTWLGVCDSCVHQATNTIVATTCGHLFCKSCLDDASQDELVQQNACLICDAKFSEETASKFSILESMASRGPTRTKRAIVSEGAARACNNITMIDHVAASGIQSNMISEAHMEVVQHMVDEEWDLIYISSNSMEKHIRNLEQAVERMATSDPVAATNIQSNMICETQMEVVEHIVHEEWFVRRSSSNWIAQRIQDLEQALEIEAMTDPEATTDIQSNLVSEAHIDVVQHTIDEEWDLNPISNNSMAQRMRDLEQAIKRMAMTDPVVAADIQSNLISQAHMEAVQHMIDEEWDRIRISSNLRAQCIRDLGQAIERMGMQFNDDLHREMVDREDNNRRLFRHIAELQNPILHAENIVYGMNSVQHQRFGRRITPTPLATHAFVNITTEESIKPESVENGRSSMNTEAGA